MWGAVFLLAAAGTAVFAEPTLTFPEIARGSSRIVSGWEAQEGQFPHQLSLRMISTAGSVTACGGTILTPEWGMTAAHCTATRVSVVIRAGVVNMTQPAVIFDTTKYYNHPLYNEAIPGIVQPHDIGLLEFGRTIPFSNTVGGIRIQPSFAKDENYAGVRAIASGWGRTWTNGGSPENMNWVYLSLTSNIECRTAFGGSSIVVDSTICARGYNVSSQSTCQGDSGGPLTIIDFDGAPTQVGVTSFVSGSGCHTDVPAGFIRPGHYHDWFTEVSGINFDWEYESTSTVSPVDPTATVSPVDPTATVSPVDPTATVSPVDPTATVSPVDPTATVSPVDPPSTVSPVDPTSTTVASEETTEASEETTESSEETTEISEETTESPDETTETSESSESTESSDSSESTEE